MMHTLTKHKLLAAMLAFACTTLLAFTLSGCSSQSSSESTSEQAESVELQIFAANSLTKAMDAAQEAYIADGHENISFADTQYKSSGELNELLGAGSYADVLISASKSKMDEADEAGYINADTRVDMFTNDLVMVTAEGNDEITEVTLDDIAAGTYSICVGDESVPAGNYACQALSTVGVYVTSDGTTGADTSGKGGTFAEGYDVVLDTSVGNVCEHAETGDVDIAFVYTSDVYRFGGVKVVGTVPADTHKNIVYPGAITANSEHAEEAAEFLTWCLESDKAAEIWQEWGFELA